MASTLRSQVCEQERADQGCSMSEWIALEGLSPVAVHAASIPVRMQGGA